MARYQLILHGSIEPSDEARARLKEEFSKRFRSATGSTESIFHSLPTVLVGNLPIALAESFKTKLEGIGADIELMTQDELDPQSGICTLSEVSANDGELQFDSGESAKVDSDWSLDIAPTEPEGTPIVEFEFGESSVDEVRPAAPTPVEELSVPDVDLYFEGEDPEARKVSKEFIPEKQAAVSAEFDENAPQEPPSNDDAQQAEEEFDPGSAYRKKESDKPPMIDPETGEEIPEWKQVQVDWKPGSGSIIVEREGRSKLVGSLSYVIGAGLLLGSLYLIFAPQSAPIAKVEISNIDSLLPKKGVNSQAKSAPVVGKPFTTYWSGTTSESPRMITVRIGGSEVGYDIASVTVTYEAPRKLTKQEYMQGKRPLPWLRKFEGAQLIPHQPKEGEKPDLSSVIERQIVGRAIVEFEQQSTPVKAYVKVNASLVADTNEFHGDWVVSNLDGEPSNGETNFVRSLGGDKYAFHFSGNFSAQPEVVKAENERPSPTPEEDEGVVVSIDAVKGDAASGVEEGKSK